MKIKQYNFHFLGKKIVDAENFEDNFFRLCSKKNVGLKPIFENYEKELVRILKKFNINTSKKYIEQSRWALLYHSNGKILVQLYYLEDNKGCNLKVFSGSKELAEKCVKEISKLKEIPELYAGSYEDHQLRNLLEKRLEKISPNGKKVNDKGYQPVLEKLKNDKLRIAVKKIANTYSETFVPIDGFKKVGIKKELVEDIINDDLLIQKNFRVVCSNCSYPSEIMFEDINDAQSSSSKAKFNCPNCSNKSTSAETHYSLTKKCINGVQTGVWLEKAVMDVIKKETGNYWCCRMYDNDEYDGITTLNGKTFFIDCKDTSFGQNDLYSALVKAEKIHADIILIITTNQIHENVKKEIAKFKDRDRRERRPQRTIEVISSNNFNKLTKNILDYFNRQHVTDLEQLVPQTDYHRMMVQRKRKYIY